MSPEVPKDIDTGSPEHRHSPHFTNWWVGGWLAPLLVAGGTLAWVFLIYFLIGDRPTDWKYGVVPYVPGESIFSIRPQPKGIVPPQVTLPDDTKEEFDVER